MTMEGKSITPNGQNQSQARVRYSVARVQLHVYQTERTVTSFIEENSRRLLTHQMYPGNAVALLKHKIPTL
jgi:hypothetical protein